MPIVRWWTALLIACVAALIFVPLAGADISEVPEAFEEVEIGDGKYLAKPTAAAFAPDGRVFVLNEGFAKEPGTKGGPQVKVKEPGSNVYKPLFKFDHVNVRQDRGIVGMALDKDFGTPGHNYMYLLYTYEPSVGPSDSSDARTQRVVRVTVPATVPETLTEPEQTVILGSVGNPVSATQACPYPKTPEGKFDYLGSWAPFDHTDCIPSDSVEHTVDSVVVDPRDGTLWISVGDGSDGGDFPDPIAFRSQAIDSLSGKLLHVTPEGKGIATNGTCPGVTDFDRNCTKVYARGFRNPFRFSLRPEGTIAVGDVGWKSREEIDLLSSGGGNFGWPCYEGTLHTPLWKDRPECVALYAAATPTEPPIYEYAYPAGIFSAALVLGTTYLGTGEPTDYPDEYKGALFFSDYISAKVSYLKLNPDGSPASGYPAAFGKIPGVVQWGTALNGDLVYVDIGIEEHGDFEPSVRQISAVDNHRPEARIQAAGPTYGDVPLNVDLDGSASTDPDPGETATLSYAWDLDGDEEFDDSTLANPPSRQYLNGSENVTVALRVTDVHGKSDIETLVLYPGDNPPQLDVASDNPTQYRGGELVELAASGHDTDSGDTAVVKWSVSINHAGTHTHDLGIGTGETFSFETDTVHDQPSTYDATVVAEDERGLRSQAVKLVLQPKTSELHLTSTPSGATVNHGGVDHPTPYTGVSTVGVQVGISTSMSFASGGVNYQFQSWSNGAPQSQTLTMPDGGLSLNAAYAAMPPSPGQPQAPGLSAPQLKLPPDTAGPRLFFNARSGLLNRRRAVLRGRVEDPSRVRRVQVALRAARKLKGRCLWWSARRGGLPPQGASCAKPAFMAARLQGDGSRVDWSLTLGGQLQPGRYLLFFRTTDRAGNVAGGPVGGKPVPLVVS